MNRYKTQLAFILFFLLPVLVHAKVFTVNTLNDEADEVPGDELCLTASNNCSLRAAIQESNALAGSHTIVLNKGTYFLTLEGRGENESVSGDLDIKANVSIEGAGAANTIINASASNEGQPKGLDRVFDINNAVVTLKDLSITRGEVTTEDNDGGIGGGIRVLNTILNLDNVWLYANTAGLGVGGGIFSVNSTLNIEHSVIHLNYATAGAGIASLNSNVSVNKSFFYGAVGAKNRTHMGGAIYNNGDLTISKTAFYRNSVKLDGGAIYHERGILRVSNSTFNSNRADRNGGAIYYRQGEVSTLDENNPMELNHVTIAYNHAYNLDYAEQNLELAYQLRTIDLTQFESMDTDGSILFNLDPSPEDPKATIGGGGITAVKSSDQNSAPLRIANSIIANNTYDDNEIVFGSPVDSETLLGDCATTATSEIISLGGNVDSSDSCKFTHAFDLKSIDPGDFNFGPLSSDGKFFNEANNYSPLLDQNQFNKLKPPVQLYTADSPIRNAALAERCLEDDQLDKTRGNCDIGAYEYSPPNAKPTLHIAVPGQDVVGMFTLPGPELNEATYEIISRPDISKGIFFHPDASSPNWKFSASSTATGNAEVVHKTCSQLINECSENTTIRFKIVTADPNSTIAISVESALGNPTASSVHIIEQNNLIEGSKDTDYSFPFGALFFTVENVPMSDAVTVKLQLPLDTVLAEDSIRNVRIRKLNTSGNWVDLPAEQRPSLSSGQYDHTSRVLTLRLVDNDAFDLNPETGAIRGPVALGITVKTGGIQITGAGGSMNLLICLLFFGFAFARKAAREHDGYKTLLTKNIRQ